MIEFRSMATKSAPPPPGASITITSSLVTFTLKISEKLDEKNFPVWHQEVEPMINVHNLQNYIIFPEIPEQFLTPNQNSGKENPAYHNWINQDQWLLSWLESSVFSSIMMRVLGSMARIQRITNESTKMKHFFYKLLSGESYFWESFSHPWNKHTLKISVLVSPGISVRDKNEKWEKWLGLNSWSYMRSFAFIGWHMSS